MNRHKNVSLTFSTPESGSVGSSLDIGARILIFDGELLSLLKNVCHVADEPELINNDQNHMAKDEKQKVS